MLGRPRKKRPVFSTTECGIERSIGHYLALRGFFFWKQPQAGYFDASKKRFRKHASPFVRNGVPDFIIVYKDRFIGLEVKTAKGSQSDSQKEFEQAFKDAGNQYYFIVRSVEDVENALRRVLNEFTN